MLHTGLVIEPQCNLRLRVWLRARGDPPLSTRVRLCYTVSSVSCDRPETPSVLARPAAESGAHWRGYGLWFFIHSVFGVRSLFVYFVVFVYC